MMKREALRSCDGLLKAYVDCTKENFISVVWACRPALAAVNECLAAETSDAKLEVIKADYARRKADEAAAGGAVR